MLFLRSIWWTLSSIKRQLGNAWFFIQQGLGELKPLKVYKTTLYTVRWFRWRQTYCGGHCLRYALHQFRFACRAT